METAAESDVDHRVQLLTVQTVLAHPEYLPTPREIEYHVPDATPTEIKGCIEALCDRGLLECIRSHAAGTPDEFYAPTIEGVEWADKQGLLDGLPIARAAHRVVNVPPEIERCEQAPRPPLPVNVELFLPDINASAWEELMQEVVDGGSTAAKPTREATVGD